MTDIETIKSAVKGLYSLSIQHGTPNFDVADKHHDDALNALANLTPKQAGDGLLPCPDCVMKGNVPAGITIDGIEVECSTCWGDGQITRPASPADGEAQKALDWLYEKAVAGSTEFTDDLPSNYNTVFFALTQPAPEPKEDAGPRELTDLKYGIYDLYHYLRDERRSPDDTFNRVKKLADKYGCLPPGPPDSPPKWESEAKLMSKIEKAVWEACPKTPAMWESVDNTDCPPRWLRDAIRQHLRGAK